jgi:hypothetical protein
MLQFELAVMVANTICDDSLADKKKMILKIKTLFAFDLFCQNNKFKGTRTLPPKYKLISTPLLYRYLITVPVLANN